MSHSQSKEAGCSSTWVVTRPTRHFSSSVRWRISTESWPPNRSDSADDETFISVLHRSGLRSRLWMSAVAAQPGPRFQILGSEGTFTKWGLDGQEAEPTAGMLPTDPHSGVEPDSASRLIGVDGRPRHVRNERGQCDAFYALLADALLSGRPLPVRPEDSVGSRG